jgi:hypothetical protein
MKKPEYKVVSANSPADFQKELRSAMVGDTNWKPILLTSSMTSISGQSATVIAVYMAILEAQ